jgi:hypothetical protein
MLGLYLAPAGARVSIQVRFRTRAKSSASSIARAGIRARVQVRFKHSAMSNFRV